MADRLVGSGEPTYVLAEMACAHEGEVASALRLVGAAAEAKVDGIQLQLFKAERLVAPGHPGYKATLEFEISPEGWLEIIRCSKSSGLDVWANVFDAEALAIALDGEIDVLKLHSTDVSNRRLVEAVAETGLPLSLSVGGTTSEEIAETVRDLEARGADRLILMHGFQAFPTPPSDARLGWLPELMSRFGHLVGFQDHTAGDDPMTMLLPLVAIGLGASVLEKHLTLDRSAGGTDSVSALDPPEFADFVRTVRRTDDAIGVTSLEEFSPAEHAYRSKMKRNLVAARDLGAGSVLDHDSLDFLRAEQGILAAEASSVIGRILRRPLGRYAPITDDDLV